jgi:PPP family 3-phenylpropionic acid transporter
VPLADTVTLDAAAAGRADFGRVRALGSVAFIAGTLLGAAVLQSFGPPGIPAMVALSMLLTAGVTLGLREAPGVRVRTRGLAFVLLRRPGMALLILASGLVQGSHALFYVLSTVHWRAAGLPPGMIGVLWSVGVACEILLLSFAGRLLRAMRPERLGAVAAAAAMLRWAGTAITTDPGPLLLLQALHALSFAGMLLAVLQLVQRLVPPEAAATGQALQAALGPGLAMLVLTLASGPLYRALGGGAFLAMAAVAAGGLVAVLVLSQRLGESSAPVAP